jgi:hypothetical protein
VLFLSTSCKYIYTWSSHRFDWMFSLPLSSRSPRVQAPHGSRPLPIPEPLASLQSFPCPSQQRRLYCASRSKEMRPRGGAEEARRRLGFPSGVTHMSGMAPRRLCRLFGWEQHAPMPRRRAAALEDLPARRGHGYGGGGESVEAGPRWRRSTRYRLSSIGMDRVLGWPDS